MNSCRIFFAILTLIFIGLTFCYLTTLTFPESTVGFVGETKRAELGNSRPIRQVLTIDQNNLAGFQIFMGDTDLSFGESLTFTLLDDQCNQVIKKTERDFLSFPRQRGIRFIFDQPIEKSLKESYCLSIEYQPGFRERKERPYIRVTEGDQFRESSYVDDGKNRVYSGRTLQVRPLYAAATLKERFSELENRLSQYKPGFIKGSMLMLGVAWILLGLLFFCALFKKLD